MARRSRRAPDDLKSATRGFQKMLGPTPGDIARKQSDPSRYGGDETGMRPSAPAAARPPSAAAAAAPRAAPQPPRRPLAAGPITTGSVGPALPPLKQIPPGLQVGQEPYGESLPGPLNIPDLTAAAPAAMGPPLPTPADLNLQPRPGISTPGTMPSAPGPMGAPGVPPMAGPGSDRTVQENLAPPGGPLPPGLLDSLGGWLKSFRG